MRSPAELDRPLHGHDVRKAAEDGFYFDLATFTEDFLTAIADAAGARRSAGVAACDRGTNFRFGHGGRRAGNSDQALRKCMVCYSPKSRRNLRPNRV